MGKGAALAWGPSWVPHLTRKARYRNLLGTVGGFTKCCPGRVGISADLRTVARVDVGHLGRPGGGFAEINDVNGPDDPERFYPMRLATTDTAMGLGIWEIEFALVSSVL